MRLILTKEALSVGLWTVGVANRPPGQSNLRVRLLATAIATLLLLTTAAGAWAHDEPAQPEPPQQVIQVPPSASIGEVIPLRADVPDEAETAWAVTVTPGGLTATLAYDATPGEPGGITIVWQLVKVGPSPNPPNPGPGPTPTPTPVSTLEVWVIEERDPREPGGRNQAHARTLLSMPWRNFLKDNGHSLTLIEHDAPTAPATLPGELPCVVGFGPGDDEPRFRAPLPKDGAAMLELVRRWTR